MPTQVSLKCIFQTKTGLFSSCSKNKLISLYAPFTRKITRRILELNKSIFLCRKTHRTHRSNQRCLFTLLFLAGLQQRPALEKEEEEFYPVESVGYTVKTHTHVRPCCGAQGRWNARLRFVSSSSLLFFCFSSNVACHPNEMKHA